MRKIPCALPILFALVILLLLSGCAPARLSSGGDGRGFYAPPQLVSKLKVRSTINQLQSAKLDTLVIDVKGASGEVYLPGASTIPGSTAAPKEEEIDIQELLQARKNGVRLIARLVLFLDPCFGKKNPSLIIRKPNGSPLTTSEESRCGPITYLSPYMNEVWDYNIEVAKYALKLGFDEIQLDYVRFPDMPLNSLLIPGVLASGEDRTRAITEGVARVRKALPKNSILSADVFGCVAAWPYDFIGQDAVKLAPYLDFISPMLYPSLWPPDSLGVKDPTKMPYEIIRKATVSLKAILAPLPNSPSIRPWIESGSWPPIYYGKKELDEQIRALKEEGVDSWLLWQASGEYDL